MRLLIRIVGGLLGLLALLFLLLYAYGAYLYQQAGEKEQALDQQIQSGNGFGGEAGMKIIDSEFRTHEFFWVDDDHLLVQVHRFTAENPKNRDQYIWNVSSGESLPLDIDGYAECFRDDHLYFMQSLNPKRRSSERLIAERFSSTLVRGESKWTIDDVRNVKEVWPDIPDRHEYAWRRGHECLPWYSLPNAERTPEDIPRHSFHYLSHWGWIFRHSPEDTPESGFFDIGGAIYFGQPGESKAPPPPVPHLKRIKIRYVDFLDRYFIANDLNLDPNSTKYIGLLNKDGTTFAIDWSDDWPAYDSVPLPTRKGLFWHTRGKGINRAAGLIYSSNKRVHKVIHGAVEYLKASPNGCKVAFYHRPKDTNSKSTGIKVFDACNSSIQGREMNDVYYTDRID